MTKKTIEAREKFKILYLSRSYPVGKIAKKIGIARTTVFKWKREMFPLDSNADFHKKMFIKLYDSGVLTIDEITLLLRLSRVSILRFKRNHDKFKSENIESNILENSNLRSDLVKRRPESIN